ncbi:MAG: HD domain-containing protein [Candidatus Odinarchaeota archaeon]
MFLFENLEVLNNEYKDFNIFFKKEDNLIKIIESHPFVLNDYPNIKEKLLEKYGLKFNKRNGWYIDVRETYKLKMKKIKSKPTKSIETLTKALFNFINKIEEEKLHKSIILLLEKFPQFFTIPASKYQHHDYRNGLLEHTVEILEIGVFLYHRYVNEIHLDKDLIIAGSILHDIGKVNCFELIKGDFIRIKDTSILHGHIINGVKIISQEIKSRLLNNLLHIVGSHHRIRDWGSPISPIMMEAWIIHLSDDISSKIG